ncbi:E1 [Leptonychotes weddellii papillomavirus 1]|uniref:Replication protein E1 n=1 Tax=Leptonychotes weddellii papillomavirus 1 TaxID=2077302 RepID=A0A2I8B2N1_9PAPI|nr:E1 [Leptonychotes weddellii papillomavirus 1]AUT11897.1 E1 [Leptonychotes weddellii papillomavirus 1]
MEDKKGTVDDWVLLEAECSDVDETFEELFDKSSASDISDLIDNTCAASPGLSQQLFHQKETADAEQHLLQLKRKYLRSPQQSSELVSLSPRLSALSISPRGKKAKKQLFPNNDSGIEVSHHEADNSDGQQTQVENDSFDTSASGRENGAHVLLKLNNRRSYILSKFKDAYGLSFPELCRIFNSDKTCSSEWVIIGMYLQEERADAAKTVLENDCTYIFMSQMNFVYLFLLSFKVQKSRETLFNLLKNLLNVAPEQLYAQPPKTRSAAAALYWFKKGNSNCAYTFGELPKWIAQQTLINHQLAAEKPFNLSVMIQWAYDNNWVHDSDIAYNYALQADEDENALAFLNSNSQAKIVRDCGVMVRHYKKAEMHRASISEWIYNRIKEVQEGDWKSIVHFLRFQCVEFIGFLTVFKKFLRGVPKKNCMVIWGPPNTGKSLFCMSLLKFMKGRVVSYVNSRSQFWLEPLADAKMGLLDDATAACWNYIDVYLRNALDGNEICIDMKHKTPRQIKCPPLLITSNLNVCGEEKWKYLRSRVSCFCFANEFPLNEDGTPGFALNDESWGSFFKRFWKHIELSGQEDEGDDGESQQNLRLFTRTNSNSL